MKVTGAQALFKSLEGEGVDLVFGIPGGAILPAYDPLVDSKIRHILCRHEQGAGHAAEGYAWATGRVGVAIPIKVRPTGLEPSAPGPATPVTEMPTSACRRCRTPLAMAAAVCSLTAPCTASVSARTPSISILAALE